MPTILTSHAVEQGTIGITAAFTDETGAAVMPSAVTWTLCDDRGVIINSRENVEIDTPASEETIVLSGDDLQILNNNNEYETRYLEVTATYTGTLGDNLPCTDRAEFKVINLKGKT